MRKGLLSKSQIAKNYGEQQTKQQQIEKPNQQMERELEDDDFEYLNDDDEYYEEDYEDYEDPNYQPQPAQSRQQVSKETNNSQKKNTFLTYCQEYENQDEEEGQAEWDLDMDEDADFV